MFPESSRNQKALRFPSLDHKNLKPVPSWHKAKTRCIENDEVEPLLCTDRIPLNCIEHLWDKMEHQLDTCQSFSQLTSGAFCLNTPMLQNLWEAFLEKSRRRGNERKRKVAQYYCSWFWWSRYSTFTCPHTCGHLVVYIQRMPKNLYMD